jgi:uncharacterized delta-60 repeat protein
MKNDSPFSPSLPRTCVLSFLIFALVLLALVCFRQQKVSAQAGAGSLSFSQSNYSVNEGGGSAAITLTRTGGSTGRVSGKLSLTDVTTSPGDYVFKPGSPDLAFPTQQLSFFYHGAQSIALQSDGKIILASPRVRLTVDGAVDPTFNAPVFNNPAYSAAIQADGKIVFVGGFTTVGGVRKNGVVRLNSDGSLDTSFDVGGGTSDAEDIAFQSDGKILIGGIFTNFGNDPNGNNPNRSYVVRLNTDGSTDTTFVKGTDVSSTYALAVQPDGKILMGGWGLARLNPNGSTDTSFNCQLGAVIDTLVIQPDGKILAGGGFDHFGSQAVYNIARINADGSLDSSFNTGSGPSSGVSTIALQPDGKMVIGGSFDTINGSSKPKIARLNSDGTVDQNFAGIGSVSGTEVDALLFQDSGKLVASGFFSFNTSPVNYFVLARFNGDLFATWNDGDSANKTINLPIVDDSLQESNETLNLSLTPVSGGATAGAITSATLTIIDNDVAPVFTSGAPPQGIPRTPYSHMFTATGSPAPTFSLTAGTLPNGLFLSSSGLLSGTPTTAGTFSGITVTANNGVAPAATQTFSITILSGGALQFSSPSYNVAENAGSVTVTVNRTGGTAGTTAVSYNTFGGTATSGSDYTSASGTLTFLDGETSKTFSVTIINDTMNENDETISLSLFNVTGSGSLGTPTSAAITIQDDDPPPSISIGDAVALEGNSGSSTISFPVTLSSPSGKQVSFSYASTDGTASAGTDFNGVSGSLNFLPGTGLLQMNITVTGDTVIEPDETFTVTLTNPQNATIARSTATATIINDDNGAGNPIDLPGFYVHRQYFDFLNRNPDADGFNFWKGTITQCGSDASCIEVQRINASGAFFLSIEFQQTGYLVERFYKTAYGDASGTSTFGSTHQLAVPIVRLSEFRTDTALIAQGVIVLQPGWEQVLETNKQNFANTFAQRTRFLNDYPTGMTAADFVDKLNGRAGSPLSTAERNQLVSDLSTNAKTRAQVVRTIAEHTKLASAEFNRAFVLMQFFGYLRRNPNDSPDGDYTGYDFWLTKMNQFNGDYIGAEMVKAFIGSSEYRKRFGP